MKPATVTRLFDDAVELSQAWAGSRAWRDVIKTVALADGYTVLALTRAREWARRYHLPGVNRALRLVQTGLYGVEIGKDVTLGAGVCFVHTLGVVIGGDSRVGDRVKFMGNNTVGTAKDNGYPVIEDDVVVGCGARILGPVRVGRGAIIGANAVVLSDVPARAVAVGIPAEIRGGARDSRAQPAYAKRTAQC